MSNYVGRGGGQVDSQIYTSKVAVLQRLNIASKKKPSYLPFSRKDLKVEERTIRLSPTSTTNYDFG